MTGAWVGGGEGKYIAWSGVISPSKRTVTAPGARGEGGGEGKDLELGRDDCVNVMFVEMYASGEANDYFAYLFLCN